MSEPAIHMVIATKPLKASTECWALAGTAEDDTDAQLRLLADRLVQAWIETREQRQ